MAVSAAFIAPPAHPHKQACQAAKFPVLAEQIWDPRRWQRGAPRKKAVRAAHRLIRCAAQPIPLRHKWTRERRSYGRYRALRLVAPYPGGGTYWAIPYYIVYCESRGEWTAYNASGALGPYQLLGWGAPYPATTWRAKMENHHIAADVWAGGAGASNWACA